MVGRPPCWLASLVEIKGAWVNFYNRGQLIKTQHGAPRRANRSAFAQSYDTLALRQKRRGAGGTFDA
jgi:hypothetical protein